MQTMMVASGRTKMTGMKIKLGVKFQDREPSALLESEGVLRGNLVGQPSYDQLDDLRLV